MTGSNIQSQFTDAPCVTQLTAGQLAQLMVILLWKILNGNTPMTGADIQDLINSSPCVAQLMPGQKQQVMIELLWLIYITGGGGGGSPIALEGDNFCFSGAVPNQVLKIKNITTGLANRIDTKNTDPTVTLNIDDGSAC
jgi:hypothetical protein